jgi:sulfoxide reductase catalytic subunit YedY
MATILDLVEPSPAARWVVFYSLGEGSDGGTYYDAHPIEQMRNHLTMLAYDMNATTKTTSSSATANPSDRRPRASGPRC